MTFLDSLRARFANRRDPEPPAPRDGASTGHSALASPSSFAASQLATTAPDNRSAHVSRRDLLRIALRDVKARLGIPGEWVQMHAMGASSTRRGQGVHACLSVQHWHPLLMQYAPAIEHMLVQRTILIDPQAVDWLIGVSWKFELDAVPDLGPFPPSSAWTSAPAAREATAGNAQPSGHAPLTATAEMGVIAGPVLIPDRAPTARERLNAELARGDRQRRVTSGLEPTEPAKLH